MIENSKAIILVGLLLWPSWALGKGPYVDYSAFHQWVQLAPEAQSLEVCGLTTAAHSLWSRKELRVPESTFMPADYSGTGRKDWIVQLHQPASDRPCDYILIVTGNNGAWERLFFKKIQPNKASWAPRWFSRKGAIAIDIAEHRRRTGAAEMFWSEGEKWSKPGFVVEDALIDTWIERDKEQKKYVFKNIESAEWWEIDQE